MPIYNCFGPKAFLLGEIARASTYLGYSDKSRTK